jgi:hypothetical protein
MSIKLFKQAYASQIDLEPLKFKSELYMEAFLIENPDILSISDINSKVEVIKTQIHMKEARPKENTDGRLDMLIYINGGGNDEEYLAIVELKAVVLKDEHLDQLHDYLRYFNDPKKRNEIFEYNKINTDFKGKKLIDILIGIDIDSNLKAKFLEGQTDIEGIETFGMTLNRFVEKKLNESYLISETFAKKKSSFNRIRFSLWEDYEKNQKANGVSVETLSIAKSFIDYFKNALNISDDNINYTNRDFSLNNPNGKKVKVFAYCSLGKSSIKVYFTHLNGKPSSNVIKPHLQRYPNQYIVELKKAEDFTDNIKSLIEQSYKDILER